MSAKSPTPFGMPSGAAVRVQGEYEAFYTALIGLRARDAVLARSRTIVDANLALLDPFFERQAARIRWVRPAGGPIGFPELLLDTPVEAFVQNLLDAEGVLLAPGPMFGHPGNHARLGFGRTTMPAALERLEAYLDRTAG